MIAACLNTRDEADIIGLCIRHLLANGVDRFYICDANSIDGTRDIFTDLINEGADLRVEDDTGQYWQQDALTNGLIAKAGADGATFVLPVDADEFPYAPDGRTIAETLTDATPDKICMQRWLHNDWDFRRIDSERMPKVAFRYTDGVRVDFGNHDCNLPGGAYGVLEMRELSFRSFEHFCIKNRKRIASLSPESRSLGYGVHQTSLEGYSREQMQIEWEKMLQIPCVYDPIPLKVTR